MSTFVTVLVSEFQNLRQFRVYLRVRRNNIQTTVIGTEYVSYLRNHVMVHSNRLQSYFLSIKLFLVTNTWKKPREQLLKTPNICTCRENDPRYEELLSFVENKKKGPNHITTLLPQSGTKYNGRPLQRIFKTRSQGRYTLPFVCTML